MARVVLTGLTHRYPSTATTTIDNLSLDVPDGELLVVLGGTGSGKTTLLRLINGMETPTAGTCLLYTSPSPRDPYVHLV